MLVVFADYRSARVIVQIAFHTSMALSESGTLHKSVIPLFVAGTEEEEQAMDGRR